MRTLLAVLALVALGCGHQGGSTTPVSSANASGATSPSSGDAATTGPCDPPCGPSDHCVANGRGGGVCQPRGAMPPAGQ